LGSYNLELNRWNVKNDGTDAVNTSIGINNALVWASQQGYVEVVLPKGTYLIDENNSIVPQSFMTLNLGGSTLRVRDNNLETYNVVLFDDNQQFARITNGKIQGDRYTHDYSNGGTHEFGVGIKITNLAKYISIDNLEIFNATGDAIIAITSYGGISGVPDLTGNFESGNISITDGTLIVDSNAVRSTIDIPLDKPEMTACGYFGLYGDSYGGLGSDITTDVYDVFFYTSTNTFLSSKTKIHFFDEVIVPTNASYAKVVLHQSTIPTTSGCTITIRSPQFPQNIYIEKCDLHDCRRLGVSICGTKHFYVDDCDIYNNAGIAPEGGIDIEDGYDINQYIYINGNSVHDNGSYSIAAVSGRNIHITKNKIDTNTFSINSGVKKSTIEGNFIYASGYLEGESLFSNNQVYGAKIILSDTDKQILMDNNYYHNSTITISRTKSYCVEISNSKFYNDADFLKGLGNLSSTLVLSTEPQKISNCIIEGSGIERLIVVPSTIKNGWILDNVTFVDTRHYQDQTNQLPPGNYNGCKFVNCGKLDVGCDNPISTYNFNDCSFEWDSYILFYVGSSKKVGTFRFYNSYFNGGSSSAFFFTNTGVWGNVEFINTKFDYPSSTSTINILEFYGAVTIDSVLMQGNKFTSNNAMIAVKADAITSEFIFRDNYVKTVTLTLPTNAIKLNNIINGVVTN
jgi:hypothetical protein